MGSIRQLLFTLVTYHLHLATCHQIPLQVERPSLALTLTPLFEPVDLNVTSINVTMQLQNPKVHKGGVLVELALGYGPIPTARYDGDAIQASDGAGPLGLIKVDTVNDGNPWRSWVLKRSPSGDVILSFTAPGRIPKPGEGTGPRIDLRVDQGGLVGKGMGFLPTPPGEDDWDFTVEWVLDGAPENYTGVWSAAPGVHSQITGVPSEVIGNACFAVGPLVRWVDPASPRLTVYWIGSPPWDMGKLSRKTAEIFDSISGYFGDTESDFTVFFRRVDQGHGGTGGYRSFLLEYDEGTEHEMSLSSLNSLLAHEIVHEYPLSYPVEEKEAWYIEGIADYYVSVILRSTGVFTREEALLELRSLAQAYYTSPVIHISMDDVLRGRWGTVHAMRIPYSRGFVYLAKINGQIVAATNGTKSLDDVVMEMYRRQRAREPAQAAEFVQLVGDIIGHVKAQAGFDAMWRGDLIVPNGAPLLGFNLVRKDRFRFELGFDSNSMRTGIVAGLQKGSRAEEAGVREGDEIVSGFMVWTVADYYDMEMEMVVSRGPGSERLKWWPRSWDLVECWEWEDRKLSRSEL